MEIPIQGMPYRPALVAFNISMDSGLKTLISYQILPTPEVRAPKLKWGFSRRVLGVCVLIIYVHWI
jgi:hypothetical protein